MIWRDCRLTDLDAPEAPWNREAAPPAPHDGRLLLTAWQLAALARRHGANRLPWIADAAVTAPDFLHYARLINTGQAATIARLAGGPVPAVLAAIPAALHALRQPIKAAKKDFWTAAGALLRFDIALLPSWHRGPVLLHSQVADMAFALDRGDFLRNALRACAAKNRPAGFHTQQTPAALSAIARWRIRPQYVALLHLPDDAEAATAIESAHAYGLFDSTSLLFDSTLLPRDWTNPETCGPAVGTIETP